MPAGAIYTTGRIEIFGSVGFTRNTASQNGGKKERSICCTLYLNNKLCYLGNVCSSLLDKSRTCAVFVS